MSEPVTGNKGVIYALEARPPKLLAIPTDGSAMRTVIAEMGGTPDGIQVDRGHRTLYWTNMGADFAAADGTVERSDLDGSNRRTLVGSGATVTPKQIVLDEDGGFLYWCDREGMRVMRSRLDGSEVTTLVQTGVYPQDSGDIARHCVGLALDRRRGHLYWTQKGPPDGGVGRIFRAGLALPPGADPSARADIEVLVDKLPEPIDLELDVETSTLYWTDRGHLTDGNSLNKARVDASGLSGHVVLARGLEDGIGLALDLRGRRAYVSDLGGKVRFIGLAGGELTTLSATGPLTGIVFVPSVAR